MSMLWNVNYWLRWGIGIGALMMCGGILVWGAVVMGGSLVGFAVTCDWLADRGEKI